MIKAALALLVSLLVCGTAFSQRQMERLGRGVVVLKSSSTQVYVGWRLLGNDPADLAFNLYRSANGAAAVKVNVAPLTATTDYLDNPPSLTTTSYSYSVRPVLGGVEVTDGWANLLSPPATLQGNAPTRQYVPVPMVPTPDDTTTVSYKVKFCWVGDFDGNGEYDFLVDRYNPAVAARQWLQAYKRDGTLLWQMNMGPNSVYQYNIEPGSSAISIGHGDNVTVYDMDGDGKSEVVIRTSNGVVFGDGAVQSGGASENVQFLSIVDGLTGAQLARSTVPNPRLGDGPMNGHMGILYLDGRRPSVLLAAKNRAADNSFHGTITAWDWRGGLLTQRWSWVDSGAIHAPEGHQIRIADVDNDGKDEFVDIGYVLDDNGTQLFNIPEIVHGDRFHLTDIDPDRPGLENFIIQQNNGSGLATAIFDPGSGAMIRKWYAGGVVDVGRGVVADMDASSKGCEFFSTQPGIFNAKGNQIYASRPFPPEAIWWDADLSREFVATVGSTAESPAISKFNPADPGNFSRIYTIYNETPPGVYQAYGGRPAFWGDILGDWREELLCVANDNSELRIYSPKTTSTTRLYTLMQNPQYRCQATAKGYAQASYVDYYLGNGMTPPPPPPMVDAKLVWRGGTGSSTWDVGSTHGWTQSGTNSTFANGDSVRFDIGADSTTTVQLSGTLQPAAVSVYSPANFTFDGSSGSLAGGMTLLKSGAGKMTISGNHPFNGRTTVWDGALNVDGDFQQSPVTVWGGIWGGALSAGDKGGRIGGSGRFSQPVSLQYRGAITPGSGMGNAGTLTLGAGLTAVDGAVIALDLSDDPSGAVRPSDRIAVTGNLSLTGKTAVVIKALNGQLAPGTYTLLTYTGTLAGSAANLDVTVPAGTPFNLAVGSGAVNLTVPVTRAPAAITWRGTGNAWDLASSQNWLRGGAPDVFVSGDTITFDSTGAAAPVANLIGLLPIAGATFNSTTPYTLSGIGALTGSGGLTKTGTGTLTINTTNDYTGPTVINGGVVAVGSLADAGNASSIGAGSASAANLVLNNGVLTLTGAQTNTNRSLTLGAGGGTLDVAVGSSSMQISGTIIGGGKLTKTGPGTLILAKANSYTGGTLIQGGTIYLAGATANSSALGNGLVTLQSGTLSMANVQASETAAWNINVPVGATGRLNADGRCTLSGSLTGGGDFTFYTPYIRTEMTGNWSAFSGRIFVVSDADGGDLRMKNTTGYPAAQLDLGDQVYAYYNNTSGNLTIPIGALSGVATSVLRGGLSAGGTITWQVGAKNVDTTFAGTLTNNTGPTALTKVGTGTLSLTGASNHTGATAVSGGRLRINGSTSGSSYTVQNGATLGGAGSITGNVTFQTGGGLEHGSAGSAPLAVTGNLTFGASAMVRPAAGAVLGVGNYTLLTYAGTLLGTPNLSWVPPPDVSLIATFNTATPGIITMSLAEQPGALSDIVWTGSTNFNWDSTTANWTDGTQNAVFSTAADVSFTESGNAASPVNLALDVEPGSVTVDSVKNYTFAGVGKISGTGTLKKSGPGTLNLTISHTYSGGTYLNGGTLFTSTEAAMTTIGGGPVIFQGGTLQQLDTNASYSSANYAMQVAEGQTGTLRCDSRIDLSGSLTGSGIFNLYVPWVRFKTMGDWSAFTGRINVTTDADGGLFRIANGAGLPSVSVALASKTTLLSFLNYTHTLPVGSLSGETGSYLSGSTPDNNNPPAGTIVTWQIGGKNLNDVFLGVIQNGNGSSQTAIQKTGTGSLTLGGVNVHTGPTTVTSGKLIIAGSLANSSTTVAAAGTLGGTGTLAGAVTCNGTLAPGITAGVLTLSNGLTLAPSSVLEYDLGTVSDRTAVSGDLTLAGTLNVAAASGFGAGSYLLFNYTGTLIDEPGLQLGSLPDGFEATINTSTAGQVRLVVTQILTPFQQWQIANFSSTTDPNAAPDADPDGDGTLNDTEFRLGLDPKNGAAAFKATVAMTPAGFTLQWPAAAGLVFEILRSSSLDAPWEVLDTVTGVGTHTDANPLPGEAFYRIALLP